MRIFLTGMGAISCLGDDMAAHRAAFEAGVSGVAAIGPNFPDLPTGGQAGLVRTNVGNQAKVEYFLGHATREAIRSANLPPQTKLPVFLGSTHGDLDAWQTFRKNGGRFDQSLWELLGGSLADFCQTPDVTVISTACTASSVAMGLAYDALRLGQTEVAIVAGVESLTPFLYRGFESLKSLAADGCRPFDRDRDGLILGEGAAAIILETENHARKRLRPLSLEMAGYGFGADGTHLTAPDPAGSGACGALRKALGEAGVNEAPDFINAHGTGTKLNDRMECIAIQKVFGEAAAGIPLTSTKPLTGHLCGAAGAMEIVSTALGLETGFVPPILGFREPDAEFAHFDFVHDATRTGRFGFAVSMNSGFGGANTAIVLRRNH